MPNSGKPIRLRSPRFPSHSLDEALLYARKIYEAIHRSPIDSSTAVRLMGFSGKSGASASALGSVRQYALIEGFGENTRISDLALEIFEPASRSEYRRSMKAAGFSPTVFAEISERFSGKIPTVDEPIRAYLVRDLGYSSKGATDALRALRGTLDFLATISEGPESDSPTDSDGTGVSPPKEPEVEAAPGEDVQLNKIAAAVSEAAAHARFPISRDCYAEITLLGEITPQSLLNLKRQVEFLTEIWAEEG